MKNYHFIFLLLISFISNAQQAPQKSFTQKLDGIQTSSKELTKSASTDNSSVGQSGVMSTSVPLVTVKSRTMEFPLQLHYTAGIKTDQKSGPVGLGWVLPVGSIRRDYGAFQPDYTSTLHEGDMWNQKYIDYMTANPTGEWTACKKGCLNPEPSSRTIYPYTHNRELQYSLNAENQREIPLSDLYNVSVPGLGGNTFWNGGAIGAAHSWKWNEASGWNVQHDVKTYVIDQEYSRINEANIGVLHLNDKTNFLSTGSHAVAIGMLPYVKNSYVGTYNEAGGGTMSQVRYEDFGAFTITDENGTHYVFGRALRGQKYIFQEDPYWSTTESSQYYLPENGGPAGSPKGSFWKTDYIAEWLLTEIRSADYEDSNGNGIADDGDAGDWIRFEYTEPTQTIQTVPNMSGGKYLSTVPKHREWSSFSQTDQASSLMRELAYLTKIVTPAQELVFKTSQRYDVDHDYYAKPANKVGTYFYYEDRQATTGNGTAADFDIKYPVETMRYDEIEVFSRLMDKMVYPSENLRTGRIKLNYAAKGSPQELAVSDFLIRNNNDTPKMATNGKQLGAPSNSGFAIADYNNGADKRGKTTLLSVDFFGAGTKGTKTSYQFEYAYNPSYSEIHKREIVRKWSSPSLRTSNYPNLVIGENIKANIKIPYTEQVLGATGLTTTTVQHTGVDNELFTYEFLIDIPYHERHYKMTFANNALIDTYVENGHTSIALHNPIVSTEIAHPLQPVKDAYGYLYAENCTKCPQAWSLTKITYPTGGEVRFDYELGEFEVTEDEPNWSFDRLSIPLIGEYNELARHRSAVQDAYSRYDFIHGRPGVSPTGTRKTLTATFEVDLPAYYGIRLKSKTTNDRINPEVVTEYQYGTGHFTSCPTEYVQSVIGNFNSFILRELYRTNWELGKYGADAELWTTDFREKMRYPAVSDLSLDSYQSTHFYETISVHSVDQSFTRRYYGPVVGGTIPYGNYNLFCYKLRRAGFDGAYILGGDNVNLPPIAVLKTEFFDAASSTIPYKSIANTYSHVNVSNYSFAVDYTGGTSNPNTMTIWSNSFEVWKITHVALQNIYAFGYVPSILISKSLTLPYNGDPVYSYKRWASFRTSLVQEETNYKGMVTSAEYVYNHYNQLKEKTVSGIHTAEKYITTYDYAYETYAGITNKFEESNLLSYPTRVNTYLNEVTTTNAISATMQTYDYSSFSIPRPLHSYAYETTSMNPGGTFTVVPFNLTASSNPNWRKTEQEYTAYNRQGMPIASKTNQLFEKTVYGNNLTLPKAQFMFPDYAFDATYTGFEDMPVVRSINTMWTPQSYRDETWFATPSGTVDEPAYSVFVNSDPTPCGMPIPAGSSGVSRYENMVTVDNVTGLQVGDEVIVQLTGNANSIPVNYTTTVETTISAIYPTSVHLPNPTPATVNYVKDYIICFSDPVVYPGSSEVIGGTGDYDESAYTTISETKVTKRIINHFQISSFFRRTGNYSCQLSTKKTTTQAPSKTPVRPVKLTGIFDATCVPSTGEPGESGSRGGNLPAHCYREYEASVWLAYRPDIASVGGGTVIVTPKSSDAAADARYRRGDVTTTNNNGKIKIVCDIYTADRSSVVEQFIFYPEALDQEWKQYTVNLETDKLNNYWLDVYVVNEREQIGLHPGSWNSLFADDLLVYPKGAKYNYTMYEKFGTATHAVDNNDVFVKTVYDDKGRPHSKMNAYGSIVKEYNYMDAPVWPSQNNYVTELTRFQNSQYHENRYYLDGFGKTKQVATSDPGRGLRVFSGTVEHDAKGNVVRAYKPYALKNAQLNSRYDQNYAAKTHEMYITNTAFTEVTYEAKPEQVITSVAQPKANVESAIVSYQTDFINTVSVQNASIGYNFLPDQLLVHELTDANGNPTRTYMDNLGRVVMEEQRIGKNHLQNTDGSISIDAASSETYARTWFVYDKTGRITDIYDPEGKHSVYTYNSLGLVISSTVPDKGTTEMRYDRYGQMRFTRNQKDIDAGIAAGGKPQFNYTKYDVWGRATESGMLIANDACTSCTSADWFNDVAQANNQNFPTSTTKQLQVHVRNEYDGERSTFDSDALIRQLTFGAHVPQLGFMFSATSSDVVKYTYMADGQLATTEYSYNGLPGTHIIKQHYNTFRIPTGKEYVHPSESQYNFLWSNEIDNFGRVTRSETVHNAQPQESGSYYYDLMGKLLYTGLGKTNNPADPHLDYMVYRMNVRDQLTDMRSKTLRIGLSYDKTGNITSQRWSNEHFDPSTTAPVPVNVYDYYYDGMKRLTGADYKSGTYATNPFTSLTTLIAGRPNDFSCGVVASRIAQALEPGYNELDSLAKAGSQLATDAKNVLAFLESTYISNNVAYNSMSGLQQEQFQKDYLDGITDKGMKAEAYEYFRADKVQDTAHKALLTNGLPFEITHFKYTRELLTSLPYDVETDCQTTQSAVVYGFMPTMQSPTTTTNTAKYDAAYWYRKNGNMNLLHRNDDAGITTQQEYTYSTAQNNHLSSVTWSRPSQSFTQTHGYTYDPTGNLLTDPKNGVTNIEYNSYNDLPQSIENATGVKRYRYNAQGMRLFKEGSNSDRSYYIDGVVLNGDGDVVSYQTATGYAVPYEANHTIELDYFYYLKDWLGTVRGVLDADGTALNANDHYPYGLRMPGRAFVTNSEGERYQFTGHEFDSETTYDYHGARYYNRELGRYMSVDPLAMKFPGWSTYAYTYDNPINFIDPFGLEGVEPSEADKANGTWTHPDSGVEYTYDSDANTWSNPNNHFTVTANKVDKTSPDYDPFKDKSFEEVRELIARGVTTEKFYWSNEEDARELQKLLNAPLDLGIQPARTGDIVQIDSYAGFFDPLVEVTQYGISNGLQGTGMSESASNYTAAGVTSLGALFLMAKPVVPSRAGLTNAQLVQKSAVLAERAIGGKGGVAGTAKHQYAKNLLSRYQSIYGDRGFSLGSNYFNGPAGKGFLDVVNHETMTIYDFKFGNAVMSKSQFMKYSNSFPGYSIQVIKP